MVSDYWNHNSAYHPWLIPIAARHHGDVLDVGCGEGLLLQRLAPLSRSVTGIDPDPTAVRRARERLAAEHNAIVEQTGFEEWDPRGSQFDLITFVACVHHMDLRSSLLKARRLLRPSGEIVVVGLSANKTVRDWLWSAACLPMVRIGSWLHAETRDIGVPVAEARKSRRDSPDRRRRPSRSPHPTRSVLPISAAVAIHVVQTSCVTLVSVVTFSDLLALLSDLRTSVRCMGEVSSAVDAITSQLAILHDACDAVSHRELVGLLAEVTTVARSIPALEHRVLNRLVAETNAVNLGIVAVQRLLGLKAVAVAGI